MRNAEILPGFQTDAGYLKKFSAESTSKYAKKGSGNKNYGPKQNNSTILFGKELENSAEISP